MSKRETKFNASWSEKYAWISKDKNCIHSARCSLCSKPDVPNLLTKDQILNAESCRI